MNALSHWSAVFFASLIIGYGILHVVYSYVPIAFYVMAIILLFFVGIPWGWRIKKIRPSFIVGVEVAIVIVFIQQVFFSA